MERECSERNCVLCPQTICLAIPECTRYRLFCGITDLKYMHCMRIGWSPLQLQPFKVYDCKSLLQTRVKANCCTVIGGDNFRSQQYFVRRVKVVRPSPLWRETSAFLFAVDHRPKDAVLKQGQAATSVYQVDRAFAKSWCWTEDAEIVFTHSMIISRVAREEYRKDEGRTDRPRGRFCFWYEVLSLSSEYRDRC